MENLKENADIIDALAVAYGMELETAQNYIANSVHLDGVRSEVIKKALAADVAVEVQHALVLFGRSLGDLARKRPLLPKAPSLSPSRFAIWLIAFIAFASATVAVLSGKS